MKNLKVDNSKNVEFDGNNKKLIKKLKNSKYQNLSKS